jgi:hypothetical protein
MPSPTVIGGVGGSGTRVVAQILLDLGLYMGADLNPALDNLWFTVLFRKPVWYSRLYGQRDEAIHFRLHRFARAMQGLRPNVIDMYIFTRAAIHIAFQDRHWKHIRFLRRIPSFARAGRIDLADYVGWGWKEPNAHLYLDLLAEHFPDLRYIHTIRHGLDMAYSTNQQQLQRWGAQVGITPPRDKADVPRAALAYWVAANRAAIQTGQERLGDRFLLLNFDELCRDPAPHVERLLAFLGREVSTAQRAHLASLPQLPDSVGRYKHHDLSMHDPAMIQAVRDLGFAVES